MIRLFFQFLQKQWFLPVLILAVFLGVAFPEAATINKNSLITKFLVMVVFLGMGMTLPTESLIRGLTRWKNHLFIQLFIFVCFPAITFLTLLPVRHIIPEELYIGILALSALPTTISTCVIFTRICAGDAVLSLFNASFSNLIGIAVSPILLSILLNQVGRSIPLEILLKIILSLSAQIALPLAIGQIIRKSATELTEKIKDPIGVISNIIILIIVFFSLSKSASNAGIIELTEIFIFLIGYLIILHAGLTALAVWIARAIKMTGSEQVAVLFTAPQKTLAMGVPLLTIYFAGFPDLEGIVMFPLLFYHPWQLCISGIIKSFRGTLKWIPRGE